MIRKLLCHLLGLHHYVFEGDNIGGCCKHCGAGVVRTISEDEFRKIRDGIELRWREENNNADIQR